MDRLACVDLPAFPLQLLLRRHPTWCELPAVVVAEDKPQACILWVNERARQSKILPGQRYAHALGLSRGLRAGVVTEREIQQGVAAVAALLRDFTPEVEPADGEPGTFWLNATGLGTLFKSVGVWARAIRARLRQSEFTASVVAGFTRFGTYVVARAGTRAVAVFRDREVERDAANDVKLDRLDLAPTLRDTLHKLGVFTVGAFLRLPAGGLLERFGSDAFRFHSLAAGDRWDPLQPQFAPETIEQTILLDDPETNTDRLLFLIKRALDPLLEQLAANKHALSALVVDLVLYRHAPDHTREIIRPAEPTLDSRSLLRLVHLRLESTPPRAGVVEILLTAASIRATREQLSLFRSKPVRDLRAANEAFARIRAEFGNDAVVRASLRDGHLPEARYRWERLECAAPPNPRTVEVRPLIRRIHHPVMLQGIEHGAVSRLIGPYIVSGGWWNAAVHREYHFAEMRRGECLWIYYDRRRRRWFLQGQVE